MTDGFREFRFSPVLVALFLPITLVAVILQHPLDKLTSAADHIGVDVIWFYGGTVVIVMLVPVFLNVLFNLDLIFIALWKTLTFWLTF